MKPVKETNNVIDLVQAAQKLIRQGKSKRLHTHINQVIAWHNICIRKVSVAEAN